MPFATKTFDYKMNFQFVLRSRNSSQCYITELIHQTTVATFKFNGWIITDFKVTVIEYDKRNLIGLRKKWGRTRFWSSFSWFNHASTKPIPFNWAKVDHFWLFGELAFNESTNALISWPEKVKSRLKSSRTCWDWLINQIPREFCSDISFVSIGNWFCVVSDGIIQLDFWQLKIKHKLTKRTIVFIFIVFEDIQLSKLKNKIYSSQFGITMDSSGMVICPRW